VAGQSRDTPLEDLVIRELDVPGRVLRKSRFEATVIIEAHALRAHDVRVSLSVNGTETSSATLHLRQGMNLIPWTTTAESGEPGPLELKVRAGGGSSSESFEAVVPVVELERIRILVYQGSIDWTSRFIKDAVRDDHTFSVLCYFSPRLKLSADPYKTSPGFSQVMMMPDSPQALSENIDVVVLANLVLSDLTATQQSAFLAFVQGGGRLLLIEPETEMASSFSGSPFELMSPVVFRMPSAQPESAESVDEFERRMKSTEDNPGSGADSPGQPLLNFALPEGTAGSRISELFGSAAGSAPGILPKFSTFAKIKGIKPGAQVLAVHPTEKTDSNDPCPLLVSERYGLGYVAALLTDGLWRWKLAVPSSSHDPEIFWQQLFRTLANREIDHAGMRFSVRPLRASMRLACNFRIEGAQGLGPTITAVSPSGRSIPVYPQLDEASGSWTFQVTPDEEGRWAVSAVDGRGAKIGASVLVANPRHGEEFSGLPADNEGLRALADSTGGAMINEGVPTSWQLGDAEKARAPIAVRRSQLWDNWPLLLAALGLYAAELAWRRRSKLL
jgi:hypothetical protein